MHPRSLVAVLVATLLVATGCGVPLQDAPAPLQVSPAPSPVSPTSGGSSVVRVYLVREDRLVEEVRTADDTSERSALELLAEGPTPAEMVVGTTTALAPGEYALEGGSGLAIVIDVPVQFTQIEGDLQLLAAAQLVWTVTDRRPRSVVRMTFEGEAIELPTDRGLTSGPVRRSDYRSVAPEDT
jgi:Sporulation and spore germination